MRGTGGLVDRTDFQVDAPRIDAGKLRATRGGERASGLYLPIRRGQYKVRPPEPPLLIVLLAELPGEMFDQRIAERVRVIFHAEMAPSAIFTTEAAGNADCTETSSR